MKVAVIIGVGAGIGYAVAAKFARAGYQVALVARQAEKLEQYSQRIQSSGYQARSYSADAGNPESLKEVLQQIQQELGAVDTLVYNAASHHAGELVTLSDEAFLEDYRVNVLGAFVAVRSVLEGMRTLGGGTILLTGGGLALNPQSGLGSLSLGKAGLRGLALLLAEELRPYNIQVSTITVMGLVSPTTAFSPNHIADKFWEIHQMPVLPAEVQMAPDPEPTV
ncbi:SDR family NAD(P)-dependent oxidoreductase [Deinococcus roseus]|nr:SDR family NAD(P)-dependent oxidoreductase [Deinococcus roseus]